MLSFATCSPHRVYMFCHQYVVREIIVDAGEISFIVLIRISACGGGEKGSNMTTLLSIISPDLTSLCVCWPHCHRFYLYRSACCVYLPSIYVYEPMWRTKSISVLLSHNQRLVYWKYKFSLFTSSLYWKHPFCVCHPEL
jgi:hypothetical protein